MSNQIAFAIAPYGVTGFPVPEELALAPGFHVRRATWVPDGWIAYTVGTGVLTWLWVGDGPEPARTEEPMPV